MEPRMRSRVFSMSGTLEALHQLAKATEVAGVPQATLELVHARVGQINGCSVCVDMHSRTLLKRGDSATRVLALPVWREAPYFTEAERAALALAEAATRLADRPDAVPDAVWKEAARHFDEAQLGALVMAVAVANAWNRLNVATRQVTGDWVEKYI